jgi:hypothetical protein
VNSIVLNFVPFSFATVRGNVSLDSNLIKLTLSLSDQVYNLIAQIEVAFLK